MEFKRRVLKDLIYVHSIVLEEPRIGDAQRRLSKISTSQRELKMCFQIFAALSDYSAYNRNDVLLRLETMIRLYRQMYLDDIRIFPSATKCSLANSEPLKTEEGNYEFYPEWSCTKEIWQCFVHNFLRNNEFSLKSLIKCFDSDSQKKDYLTILRNILKNYSNARGNNCMTLGDTIIILDAPENSIIFSTNKKDFEPICKCLNRELRIIEAK